MNVVAIHVEAQPDVLTRQAATTVNARTDYSGMMADVDVSVSIHSPSKHETFTRCCFNVGPASYT